MYVHKLMQIKIKRKLMLKKLFASYLHTYVHIVCTHIHVYSIVCGCV